MCGQFDYLISRFDTPKYCLLHAMHVVGKTISLVDGLYLLREAFVQGKHTRKQCYDCGFFFVSLG